MLFFIGINSISLSQAQTTESEPVKLKKSCIKKNPLAEGQSDQELLSLFKQVCDNEDNAAQENNLLAKAAMRFYQINQPVKAIELANQLQQKNVRGSLITDVLFLSSVSIANSSLQQMRSQEMRYLTNDLTYPPAKKLSENINNSMPAPDVMSFKNTVESNNFSDNDRKSTKRQTVTRARNNSYRSAPKKVVSAPVKTTSASKPKPVSVVTKPANSPFDPLTK